MGRVGCRAALEQQVTFPSSQQSIQNVPLTQRAQQDGPLSCLALPAATPWGQLLAPDTIWVLIRWKKIP